MEFSETFDRTTPSPELDAIRTGVSLIPLEGRSEDDVVEGLYTPGQINEIPAGLYRQITLRIRCVFGGHDYHAIKLKGRPLKVLWEEGGKCFGRQLTDDEESAFGCRIEEQQQKRRSLSGHSLPA